MLNVLFSDPPSPLYFDKQLISYETLKKEVDLQSEAEIDNLLIDCIYAGIIQGQINQQLRNFRVTQQGSSVEKSFRQLRFFPSAR